MTLKPSLGNISILRISVQLQKSQESRTKMLQAAAIQICTLPFGNAQ